MNSKEFPFIYDVTVTIENVPDLLHREINRLLMTYGREARDCLAGLGIGPNAHKAFTEYCRTKQMIPTRGHGYGAEFMGIPLFLTPMPFIVPIFGERGWHIAHREAKRLASELAEFDA